MVIKLAALAASVLFGVGAMTPPCNCEVETISCTDGVPSFATATCTQTQQTVNRRLVRLACPPGETAISAGFRHLAGPFRPLLEMSPVVPSGGHATSYRFIFRSDDGTDVKTYITCERLA